MESLQAPLLCLSFSLARFGGCVLVVLGMSKSVNWKASWLLVLLYSPVSVRKGSWVNWLNRRQRWKIVCLSLFYFWCWARPCLRIQSGLELVGLPASPVLGLQTCIVVPTWVYELVFFLLWPNSAKKRKKYLQESRRKTSRAQTSEHSMLWCICNLEVEDWNWGEAVKPKTHPQWYTSSSKTQPSKHSKNFQTELPTNNQKKSYDCTMFHFVHHCD